LKGHTFTDLEFQHLGVRTHVMQNLSRSTILLLRSMSSASVSLSMSIFMHTPTVDEALDDHLT
jgi:hypothetical protein